MSRKGSLGAERVRTDAIERARELAKTLDERECRLAELFFRALVIGGDTIAEEIARISALTSSELERACVRDLFGQHAASASGFKDDPTRQMLSPVSECLLALDSANLNKLIATGEPITKCREYEEFRDEWAPSLSTIYSRGTSIPELLRINGSKGTDRTLYSLTRRTRGGRPKKGQTGLSDQECCAFLALAYEAHYGRRISWEAWDRYRDCFELDAPRGKTLSDRFGGWSKFQAATVKFMKQRPEQFPRSIEYWEQCAKAKKKRKSKGKGHGKKS